MKNRALLISVLAFIVTLAGCMPRGETRTLDQVFKTAQNDFASADRKGIPGDLSGSLEKLASLLQEITSSAQVAAVTTQTKEISKILSSLSGRAGYTSRPGLGDLADQYRKFTVNEGSEVAAATRAKAKLLAARTYSILAAELETTKFSVS